MRVQEVKDRITFSAFTKIKPEEDYLHEDHFKKSVQYNSNQRYTVVLVVRDHIRDLWRDGDGELKIERLLEN